MRYYKIFIIFNFLKMFMKIHIALVLIRIWCRKQHPCTYYYKRQVSRAEYSTPPFVIFNIKIMFIIIYTMTMHKVTMWRNVINHNNILVISDRWIYCSTCSSSRVRGALRIFFCLQEGTVTTVHDAKEWPGRALTLSKKYHLTLSKNDPAP